jgi:SPP1 gp7 family putative phage head morphogenesis protein
MVSLLQSKSILKNELLLIRLLDRTFKKACNVTTLDYKTELPRNIKKEFGKNIFGLQFDKLITEIIKESLMYADKTMKKMSAANVNESYILTQEAVRISKDLSQEASESIVRMLQDDAIYYEHPKALSKRIVDLWGGEKYRAERFARTFTADVATATTVARYRQYGVRYMEFDAELDDRTTNQCRCLNGVQFDLEKESVDRYRPPLHHHCVKMGTKITTPLGEKNIEDIQVGDKVLTHLGHYMSVTDTMNHFPDKLVDLHTSSYHVRITPNHPILQWDMFNGVYQWVNAGDLRDGSMICTVNGYESVSVVQECEPEQVYNISVSEDESYTANGIIVHNCRSGLVPLTEDEYKPDMEFENRNFDNVLDNPDDVTRVFKNIDTFNEKYRVSKFTLDQDLGARIMFDKGFSVGISGPDLETIMKQAPTKTGTGLVDVKGNPVNSIQDVFDSIDKKSPTIEIPPETQTLLSDGNLIKYIGKEIKITSIKGSSATGGYITLESGEQLYVSWFNMMRSSKEIKSDITEAIKRNRSPISKRTVVERKGRFVLE